MYHDCVYFCKIKYLKLKIKHVCNKDVLLVQLGVTFDKWRANFTVRISAQKQTLCIHVKCQSQGCNSAALFSFCLV